MNKDNIIALAREAGMSVYTLTPIGGDWIARINPDQLERFAHLCRAELVAENERLQAQTNERGALAIANGIRMERAEAERDALRAKLGDNEWVPISREIMETQEMPDWYIPHGPMWIATGTSLFLGTYEWRQGWNPHCFIAVEGFIRGFPEVTHIRQFVPVEMPERKPT